MKFKKDVLIARLVFAAFLLIVVAIIASIVSHITASKDAKQAAQVETESETATEEDSEFSDIVVSTGVDYLDTITYVKTTSSVNLRTEASQESDVIITLPADTQLQLLDSNLEGWYKVLYTDESGQDQEGYISSDFGEIQESDTADGTVTDSEPVYKEATDNVNVRSGPGTDYDKVGALEKGTQVEVTSEDGEWSQITYGTTTGYVKSEFLQ